MKEKRLSSIITLRSKLVLSVLLLVLGRTTLAQTAPTAQAVPQVKLVSISALSAESPQVAFTFDSDVHSYIESTYKVLTITRGVPNPPSTNLVTFSPSSPTKVSVPLDFTALANADSVQISVTLSDSSHPSFYTSPFYSLDLSFLKAVQGYQKQILSLMDTNEGLLAAKLSCDATRNSLAAKLEPKQFDYLGTALVGPTTVILRFHTDPYATIQVTETNTGTVLTDFGVDHQVKFDHLAPGVKHSFKAVALNASGQPVNAFTKTMDVMTKDPVSFSPRVTALPSGPTTIMVTVDFNPSGALPANFKGYITLHYRQQLDQSAGFYSQPLDVGDGALDAIGIPKGTPYTENAHTFPITVAPGKTYVIAYTAYDEYGDVVNFPSGGNPGILVTTPAAPPALAFDKPIAVTLNSDTGLTVSWSANRAVQKAEMSVKFPDGTVVIPPITKSTSSTDVSVSTDLSGLATLLDKATKAKDSPIITISMSDGTNSPSGLATVSMSVTFVVASNKSGTQPTQKAATNVAAAVQKGKGVDWKTVLATGLGILVKVL